MLMGTTTYGKNYLSNAASLLNRRYFKKQGQDLSKEVLWVSVGQREAKLPAIKVGGLKKNFAERPCAGKAGSNRAARHRGRVGNFNLRVPLNTKSMLERVPLGVSDQNFTGATYKNLKFYGCLASYAQCP